MYFSASNSYMEINAKMLEVVYFISLLSAEFKD